MQEIVFNGVKRDGTEIVDWPITGTVNHIQDTGGYYFVIVTKNGSFDTSNFKWWTLGVKGHTTRIHVKEFMNEMGKILRGEYDDEEDN